MNDLFHIFIVFLTIVFITEIISRLKKIVRGGTTIDQEQSIELLMKIFNFGEYK